MTFTKKRDFRVQILVPAVHPLWLHHFSYPFWCELPSVCPMAQWKREPERRHWRHRRHLPCPVDKAIGWLAFLWSVHHAGAWAFYPRDFRADPGIRPAVFRPVFWSGNSVGRYWAGRLLSPPERLWFTKAQPGGHPVLTGVSPKSAI